MGKYGKDPALLPKGEGDVKPDLSIFSSKDEPETGREALRR
jgi:hypothetical protein